MIKQSLIEELRKENRKFQFNWILFPLLAFLIAACTETAIDKEFVNYVDPDNPYFIPPRATIEKGPVNGAELSTTSVEYSWSGENPNGASTFKYLLTGNKTDSSDWSDLAYIEFTQLGNGTYTFKVLEKYSSGIIQKDTTERTFHIDLN